MSVRKFQSVEQMPQPSKLRRLDPENLRLAFALSTIADGFHKVRLVPGVHKFASWDELLKAREALRRGSRPASETPGPQQDARSSTQA
jgi:hypothetical protein